MKFSEYIVPVDSKQGVLIYSTITGAVVSIPSASSTDWLEPPQDITNEQRAFLVNRMLVEQEGKDHHRICQHLLDKARLSPKVFSSYVAFSTDCNFACTYCYENTPSLPSRIMSDEVLEQTLLWYERTIEANDYRRCKIILYGGEPLLRFKPLKTFVSELYKFSQAHHVDLTFDMITNGSLLQVERIKYLIEKGLSSIQVTLDGPKEIHNERRPYKNGRGTFDKIIENLRKVVQLPIAVDIRVSFDRSNLDHISELINQLASNGFVRDNVHLYFAPIHQTADQLSVSDSFCSTNVISDQSAISDGYLQLYETAFKYGFTTPKSYTNGPCMVLASDSVTVAPDGYLYKCLEMINNPQLRIGHVKDDFYDTLYYDFLAAPQMADCVTEQCPHLPECGGGCIMESYLRTGDWRQRSCKKSMFKTITPGLLRMKYDEQ